MTKKTILQVVQLSKDGNEKLNSLFNVVYLKDIDKYKNEIEAIVTVGGNLLNNEIINKLPNLKIISTRSVGYDHIDIELTKKRNIIVTNTPDVLNDCVADIAFGLLISMSRQIVNAHNFVKSGKWIYNTFNLTKKVSGKNLGVVGLGRIGKAIAKRAQGFDMKIRYISKTKKQDVNYLYEESLLDLARWSDYLIVSAPANKENENLISKEVIEALGKDSYLINIARGSIIDETALIQALKDNKIAGAGLDVFKNEPNISKELFKLKNVILLPHIASSTIETINEMEKLVLNNLTQFFNTNKAFTPIN